MGRRRGSPAEASPPSPRLSTSLTFLGPRSSQRTRRPPARLRDCDLSGETHAVTRTPSPPPPSQPAVPQPSAPFSAAIAAPLSPPPLTRGDLILHLRANPFADEGHDESFNDAEEVGIDDEDDDDEMPLVQLAGPATPASPPPLRNNPAGQLFPSQGSQVNASQSPLHLQPPDIQPLQLQLCSGRQGCWLPCLHHTS